MERQVHCDRESSSSATSHRAAAFPAARKLTPEEINRLPLAQYPGRIHVVRAREHMLRAVRELGKKLLLGFDIEKRPCFKKGEFHPPALLQLAGRTDAHIFVLHALGLPVELTAILANPGIIKAGVAVGRDVKELRDLTEFEPRGFVDLGALAEEGGIPHRGLRGMAALLLGCRIPKQAQLTNWALPQLPERALRYAATDAWIGRRLYEVMTAHTRSGAGVR
ncbi:MAG: 3'-5' exonuclease [Verrucomicrobiota bacterium]|nr:3'-5' exonuclease [Verrucomicrobiota bacterium]